MDDLYSLDIYEIIGVKQTSTTEEIKKAYRKKALQVHPDKNPDNPHASKVFQQLTQILEVLINETARAAYDKILNARNAARIRHNKLDEKRKRFKEELEAREREAEREAKQGKANTISDEERLKKIIDDLRKQGSKQLEEEMARVRKIIVEEIVNKKSDPCRLRLNWAVKKGDAYNNIYSVDILRSIFTAYGNIIGVVISKKKPGSALIEFETPESAEAARKETGFVENPLQVDYVTPKKNQNISDNSPKESQTIFPCASQTSEQSSHISNENRTMDNFEADVLELLRKAQERKTISSQIQND